jgi:hypothetical protein
MSLTIMKWSFAGIGALLIVFAIGLSFSVGVVFGAGMGFGGLMFLMGGLVFVPRFSGMMGSATAQVDALAAKANLAVTGLPAQGRLLSMQQTGTMINMQPEVMAMVEVHHPQMGPYQVRTTVVVPITSIPQFQPGATVQVRINPQNPQDVAIVV